MVGRSASFCKVECFLNQVVFTDAFGELILVFAPTSYESSGAWYVERIVFVFTCVLWFCVCTTGCFKA